jgi:LysM repeat protein
MGLEMKSTLLFAMLTMVFAMPQASALTELEALRAKCDEHERRIQSLETRIQKRQDQGTESALSGGSTTTISNPASPAAATYQVRRGDSLERIARRNQCSVTSLAKVNHLKLSSIIHPGQNLKLPGSVKAQTAVSSEKVSATPPASLAGKTHKIRAGETYSSISRKHKIPVDALVAANPGIKPTALRPGQVIRLSAGACGNCHRARQDRAGESSRCRRRAYPTHHGSSETIRTGRADSIVGCLHHWRSFFHSGAKATSSHQASGFHSCQTASHARKGSGDRDIHFLAREADIPQQPREEDPGRHH